MNGVTEKSLIKEFEKIDHSVKAIDQNYNYTEEFVEFLIHKLQKKCNCKKG